MAYCHSCSRLRGSYLNMTFSDKIQISFKEWNVPSYIIPAMTMLLIYIATVVINGTLICYRTESKFKLWVRHLLYYII